MDRVGVMGMDFMGKASFVGNGKLKMESGK